MQLLAFCRKSPCGKREGKASPVLLRALMVVQTPRRKKETSTLYSLGGTVGKGREKRRRQPVVLCRRTVTLKGGRGRRKDRRRYFVFPTTRRGKKGRRCFSFTTSHQREKKWVNYSFVLYGGKGGSQYTFGDESVKRRKRSFHLSRRGKGGGKKRGPLSLFPTGPGKWGEEVHQLLFLLPAKRGGKERKGGEGG